MDLYEKKMKIKCNVWVSSIAVDFSFLHWSFFNYSIIFRMNVNNFLFPREIYPLIFYYSFIFSMEIYKLVI